MQPHVITKCRLCGSPHLENVLDLGIQKLTGVFPRSVDELVLEGPLELVRCVPDGEACGLLQLRHSYPQEAMYGENYGYRSGLNASMVAHLESKTKKLLSLANPPAGSLLVDILSGLLSKSRDRSCCEKVLIILPKRYSSCRRFLFLAGVGSPFWFAKSSDHHICGDVL